MKVGRRLRSGFSNKRSKIGTTVWFQVATVDAVGGTALKGHKYNQNHHPHVRKYTVDQ